jgi:thiol:disulfide interchange protein DsbD
MMALASLGQSLFFNQDKQTLLPEQEAFKLIEVSAESGTIKVIWQSAPDYYLYRKNFKIEANPDEIEIGEIQFPKGVVEEDPLFGDVEVYFYQVEFKAPFTLLDESLESVDLILRSQGCNKPVGICYPPQTRQVTIDLTSAGQTNGINKGQSENQAQQNSQNSNSQDDAPRDHVLQNSSSEEQASKSYWQYLLTAFGAGLLLVFTPCVLPMLPILSSIIVGNQVGNQKESGSAIQASASLEQNGTQKRVNASKSTALGLSVAYVVGTAITYSLMGFLAGAAGIQLQAYFQSPAMIVFMALLLAVMALAMFGIFSINMPSGVQNKLNQWTNRLAAGSYVFALVLGLLSALVVSACVSPLLISFLAVAIQQADPLLGGLMMLFMSLGMGVLLILFALGADWILPKAGSWMTRIKEFFGFALLAVAISVLAGIKSLPILLFWSALFLLITFWLWSIGQHSDEKAKSAQVESKVGFLFKALAVFALLWSIATFVGGLTGATQLLKPLDNLVLKQGVQQGLKQDGQYQQKLVFDVVSTEAEIIAYLDQAKQDKAPVVVDYYADWCTDCVRMEQSTYLEKEVQQVLESWRLLKIDVTATNAETLKAKQHFQVFGPPATLFVDAQGELRSEFSRYGYINSDDFISILKQVD